jgi:Holliday junction resolvase RusA-like endonuclease
MEKRFISCKPVTFGFGHKDPSSPYCQFKAKIRENLKGIDFSGSKKIGVSFCIFIAKERSRRGNDLDNFAKPVIDALNEAKIIRDEGQVFSICMKKVFVSDKSREGISIQIK